MLPSRSIQALLAGTVIGTTALTSLGSSHREAPFVTEHPKVDGTDFYMFNSYEPGRDGFVTLIANYQPLQTPGGGPNYFFLDPEARYDIHIDNDGDAEPDIRFSFNFTNTREDFALPVGDPGEEKMVTVPLINVAPIGAGNDAGLLSRESFRLDVTRNGKTKPAKNLVDGSKKFTKPVDNIGTKSIPNYSDYADQFVYDITLPGGEVGRMFVGQRKESFVVNLGETFDLVNLNPLGPDNAELNTLADSNITSFILEIPTNYLTGDSSVIAGWTTASLPRKGKLVSKPTLETPEKRSGKLIQVSRLANPLVNELVIGLDQKDLFNASAPAKDGKRFLDFVTHPTLPELLEILFGVTAPNQFPRDDLVATFLTGFDGLNEVQGGIPYEAMRLNTAIPATSAATQDRLGVLGGDLSGFPNGRRPGDDVVDITLRVAMGGLLSPTVAPDGGLPFTDGAIVDSSFFDNSFPYLLDPIPGSPAN